MQIFVVDTQSPLGDNYTKEIEKIREARKKRLVVVMLTVFGDDSHDEKEQRVFAVSGIVGSQAEWDEFSVVWNNRTGGIPFHAADCEAGKGEFRRMSKKERLKLYRDLVNILVSTNLMAYTATIDLQGWRTYFPEVLDTIPYYICFRYIVMHFAELAYKSIPREKVNFVFDLNNRTNPGTATLYEWIISLPEWEYKYAPCLVEEISFASRKERIGIQAADICAREGMKHLDNFFIGPPKYRFERLSMQALRATNRFNFEQFLRGYFEDWKHQFEFLEQKSGMTNKGYVQWLNQKKLDDNPVNRHKFLLWFDSMNRSKKEEKS
jgi:hypothetical protein